MQRVNLAYEVLSDPVQRQAHDFYWRHTRHQRPENSQAGNSSRSKQSKEAAPKGNKYREQSSTPPKTEAEPLGAFVRRLDEAILAQKTAIWASREKRTRDKIKTFLDQHAGGKSSFVSTLGIAAVSAFVASQWPLAWIVAAPTALIALINLGGVQIGNTKIPLFAANVEREIEVLATKAVADECQQEAHRLDLRRREFANVLELVAQPSTYDDSEVHVARRISAALFLMGYHPATFDAENRILVLKDNDEPLVVRFRHRTGSAVNVSYVERLSAFMSLHGASRGIVFSSPGLSGNAAAYARRNGISSYTLEAMNTWIDDIIYADYAGPSGDAVANLERLGSFLSGIVPKVARSYRGRRR